MTRVQLVLIFALQSGSLFGQQLSLDQARNLVENTPDFLVVKDRKGCPRSELLWHTSNSVVFQVRNRCPKSGSGMIGMYTVELTTGKVWVGVDRDELIESDRLKEVRRRLFERRRPQQGNPASRKPQG